MSGEWQFCDYDFGGTDYFGEPETTKETDLKDYADITVLLDRSGSMESIQKAMESAYDEFLKPHMDVKRNKVTLIQFDSQDDQDIVYTSVPIREVGKLKLKPRGMTPLVDAICKAIDKTGRRLAEMDEQDRPSGVIFAIITDGMENASRIYSRFNVNERIKHQTDKYNWKFVFLGANQDAIAEAHKYGIAKDWAITYTANNLGTASAMASLGAATKSWYNVNVNDPGEAKRMRGFTDKQREDAEGKSV